MRFAPSIPSIPSIGRTRRGFSPDIQALLALFPQLRQSRVPCGIPAELSFLRYAAMTLGDAVDCRYPLPNETPTEGPYIRVDCEEPLP